MSSVTVLGASGFIGSALVKKLKQSDVDYFAPGREERRVGHIIYCVGLTADFIYQMSAPYVPGSGRWVRWNDSAFDIDWPPAQRSIIARDETYPDFIL